MNARDLQRQIVFGGDKLPPGIQEADINLLATMAPQERQHVIKSAQAAQAADPETMALPWSLHSRLSRVGGNRRSIELLAEAASVIRARREDRRWGHPVLGVKYA